MLGGDGLAEELGINANFIKEVRLTYGRLGRGLVSFFSDGTAITTVDSDDLSKLNEETSKVIQNIQLRGKVNLLLILKPMAEGDTFLLDPAAYRRVRLYAVYQGYELTIKQQKAANILGVKAHNIQTWVRSNYFETFPYPSTGAKTIFLSSFLDVVPEKYHEEAISLGRVLRKEMGAQELNRIKAEIGWRDVGELHPIEEKYDPKLKQCSAAEVAPATSVQSYAEPKGNSMTRLARQRELNFGKGSWAMMNARVSDLNTITRRLKAPPEAKIFELNGEMVSRYDMQSYLILVVSSGALLAEVANGQGGMPTMMEVYRWQQDDVNFAEAMADAEKVQSHVFADTALAAVMDGDKETANLNRYQHDALLARAGMQADRFRERRYTDITTNDNRSKEELVQEAFRLLKAKPDVLASIVKEVPTLDVKAEVVTTQEEEEQFYPED